MLGMETKSTARNRGILAALSLTTLLSSLGASIANVALPALGLAFGARMPVLQWVVLAYLLGVSSLVVAAGRLGDLVGRKRLLLAGILLFSLAAGLCALAPALPLLVAARALQGAGAAAMVGLALAAVKDALPDTAAGRAMGLLGTASAVGTALGPSLGGVLVGAFGWRSIFLPQAILGIAALLCAARFLPADQDHRARPRFDHGGTLLLALGMSAYALALTATGAHRRVPLLLCAAGSACWFVRVERRSAAPLVDLRLFRAPELTAGLATSLLATLVVMATLVAGPFYLSGALGLDAGRMGMVMAVGPVVAALAGVPAGRLVDRHGARRTVLAGLAGMELGACLLWRHPPQTAQAYAASLAVLTAGYALFQAANNTAVMAGVPAARRGLVSGLLSLSRNLGLVSGAAAMSAVFAHGAASGTIDAAGPEAATSGLRACFLVAALLLALAILAAGVAWLRRRCAVQDTLP
jgi:EmrB/QacA subfamily drug resistance transporter